MSKEHPILMSTPMVQAILEGRKTQTRRVIKPQPPLLTDSIIGHSEFAVGGHDYRCPYGQVGSKLWVRETWCDRLPWAKEKCQDGPCYKSTDEGDCGYHITGQKWKSSMFMPRKYSRIILEITDIKVQRLQDIGYDDAIAEGMSKEIGLKFGFASPYPEDKYLLMLARHIYVALWDSINGKKHSWVSNPFVWVISFKRI